MLEETFASPRGRATTRPTIHAGGLLRAAARLRLTRAAGRAAPCARRQTRLEEPCGREDSMANRQGAPLYLTFWVMAVLAGALLTRPFAWADGEARPSMVLTAKRSRGCARATSGSAAT